MNNKILVLTGGGHTHALLLRRLQRQSLPCRVLLLSGHRYTPYSGMLPGVIAGLYEPEEAHIDLATLAADSGCEFLEDDVISLDADANQLVTATGKTLGYDWLSINTGSTQNRIVDGPDCISIKPVTPFLSWLATDLPQRLDKTVKFDLVIIGAGAAGVEVALAMKRRFIDKPELRIHIITARGILPQHSAPVRQMVQTELHNKGILVHDNFRVASVHDHVIGSDNGLYQPYHQVILATPAQPAPWPSDSGLSTDSQGFIRVNGSLRSCSHDNVFACGDVASFENGLAKSGVYAVRQAPVLMQNLRAVVSGLPLVIYYPQRHFLSLLSCADGRAIASKGSFRAKGSLVWLWKDWIDKRFMAQFPLPAPGVMDLSMPPPLGS